MVSLKRSRSLDKMDERIQQNFTQSNVSVKRTRSFTRWMRIQQNSNRNLLWVKPNSNILIG
jgi:hypothetical protein